MTETMIDKVAGAIATSRGWIGMYSVPREKRESFRVMARAAVAAMLVPNEAMLAAINEHAGSIAPEYAYVDAIEAVLMESTP